MYIRFKGAGVIYPEFLKDHTKTHWMPEDVFVNGRLDRIHAFVEKDYNVGMHMQSFFEINIVMSGTGRHYIENKSLSVEKGDMFIIPPDIRHGYVGSKNFDVYHMLIHKSFFEKYIAELQVLPFFFTLFNIEPLMRTKKNTALHLKIGDDRFNEVETLTEQMIKWSAPKDGFHAVMCYSSALMLIARLCFIYSENHLQKGLEKEREFDAAFMESVSLIYEKQDEKITIEVLARTAGLSRTAYIKTFKEIIGTTPAKFINERRIESAKILLLNSEFSIADIAEKTGFYDAAHFIRCFSGKEGCSPLSFRKHAGKRH